MPVMPEDDHTSGRNACRSALQRHNGYRSLPHSRTLSRNSRWLKFMWCNLCGEKAGKNVETIRKIMKICILKPEVQVKSVLRWYFRYIHSTIQNNKNSWVDLKFHRQCRCERSENSKAILGRKMPSQPFAFASGTPGNGVDLDQPESKIYITYVHS